MSMALCAGFIVAQPMNWWLVSHGKMAARPGRNASRHLTPETPMVSGHPLHSMAQIPQSSFAMDHTAMAFQMAPTTTPRETPKTSLVTSEILGVRVIVASTLPQL